MVGGEKILNYPITDQMRKILVDELEGHIVFNQDKKLNFSDNEETIIIPTKQEETKENTNEKIKFEYIFETIKKVMTGLAIHQK